MRIIQARLEGVPGSIVESDAVQFASRKVAAVSGDARRALDICRRAVELAETECLSGGLIPGKSGTPGKGSMILQSPSKSSGTVTIATIKRAINEATTSPLQQCLRGLPLSSKVLLAALIAKGRRTGISESILGDVMDEAKRMARMDTERGVLEYLQGDDHVRRKDRSSAVTSGQALKNSRVLSLASSAIELMEAGIIGLEARRADRAGRIRLNIAEEDARLAFKDDPEVTHLGIF